MKKWIALLLTLALTLGLVGCGQTQKAEEPTAQPAQAAQATQAPAADDATEEDKEPVTIEFSSWYAAEETTSATLYNMVKAFEEKYPWITVNVTEYAYNNLAESCWFAALAAPPPMFPRSTQAGWPDWLKWTF